MAGNVRTYRTWVRPETHPTNTSVDIILAACDVEGNFLVVKAYQYTTLLSCMLLDAWAIPVCLLFSWIYMRPKYHWTQILVCAPPYYIFAREPTS